MVDKDIVTAYAGARVTRLVNRTDILDEVEQAIRDTSGKTYVLYLEADGGMGKTFLAREVLRRCRKGGEWARPDLLAARHEVDFYHHQARSIDGFMAALVDALRPGSGYFDAYYEQRRRLQEAKAHTYSALNDLLSASAEMKTSFLEGCEALGEEKRLVLVLDTAEKLSYETDHVQKRLGLGQEAMGVRPWLLTRWLPKMRNSVILICGRPRKRPYETFMADLQKAAGAGFRAPVMRDFDFEETLQYLEAVRETAKKDRNALAVQRLDSISDDSRRVIYTLTGGRPITLALIIDYYLATARLLPEVKITADEADALSKEEVDVRRERVKGEVVRLLRETGRGADETIINLAWAPMGMDAELLSRVSGMTSDKAADVLKMLANPRSGLSFIKVRQPDSRVFLHDEMYALMQEHVLETMPKRARGVYQAIIEYYSEKILAQETRVRELLVKQHSSTTSSGRSTDAQELAAALGLLDDLRVEEVFYRLRLNPLSGFHQYAEYAQAAVTSRNDSLDMQLRDQIFAFVQDNFKGQSELGGLRRDVIERDSALRWGWRAVYAHELDEAKALIHHMREVDPDFLGTDADASLAWAELDIIEGWADAFLGKEHPPAEKSLRKALYVLQHLVTDSEFEDRQRKVLLAQAYFALGYLLRAQGRYQAAAENYRSALPLWRELKREADHAEVLNNLGFAQAEAGKFLRALRYTQDGLDMRVKLSYRYPIALSLNTLGLVEVKNDQPHRGRVHCEQALAIFRDLEMPRGIGLALTALAEAHRRRAELENLYSVEQRIADLSEASKHAQQAVDIFRRQVSEPLRLVDALIELGCAYRNWALLISPTEAGHDLIREGLISRAKTALEEAAEAAGSTFNSRQVDAFVNLASLYYRAGCEDERVEESLRSAEAVIPQGYCIFEGKGLPHVEDPITPLWVQLSKIHTLRGEMAMRDYNKAAPPGTRPVRDEGLLSRVSEHFTLSLAYAELFADDYRELRRAKDTIYRQFHGANVAEFHVIYHGVRATALKYDLESRPATVQGPARPRMRYFLEENFGPLAELKGGQ